ncbi:hypothetical protein CPB84DRAFT_1753341 [Gymnopilus junonius]|uniref:Uncharacterized protein n=1 Tax=Gymnopilus junonius TaxID=109634 RepID=A0A9P5NAJ8_GYMJU|nr:hypothetical protein CPB84DRAFT_1753341 [Gymnopilus junonius]
MTMRPGTATECRKAPQLGRGLQYTFVQHLSEEKSTMQLQGKFDKHGCYTVEFDERHYSEETGNIELKLIARLKWPQSIHRLALRSTPTLEAPDFGFPKEGMFHLDDMTRRLSQCNFFHEIKVNIYETDTIKDGKRKRNIESKFEKHTKTKSISKAGRRKGCNPQIRHNTHTGKAD